MGLTRLSGVLLAATLALGLLGGGCARGAKMAVPVEGPRISAEHGTTVEVSNFSGSVYVEADAWHKEPVVRARIRPVGRGAPKSGQLRTAVDISARTSIDGAARVLTVTSLPTSEPPAPIAVDLYIVVPKSSGVTVRNSGGPVELVRISGPVDVENGSPGKPGGDVQVRTGDAMTHPSTIMTSKGRVLYQVGNGSSGRFNLMTDNGEVQFSSRLGEVKEVILEPTRWRGVLNDGTNPVVLHSGDGLVRVHVIENAGTYGPEIWDGYPRWPSEPKWIGRLGGYYEDEPLFKKKTP